MVAKLFGIGLHSGRFHGGGLNSGGFLSHRGLAGLGGGGGVIRRTGVNFAQALVADDTAGFLVELQVAVDLVAVSSDR